MPPCTRTIRSPLSELMDDLERSESRRVVRLVAPCQDEIRSPLIKLMKNVAAACVLSFLGGLRLASPAAKRSVGDGVGWRVWGVVSGPPCF